LAGVLMVQQAQPQKLAGAVAPDNPIGVLIGLKRASFHKPVLPGQFLTYTVTVEAVVAGMVSARAEAVNEEGHKVCKCEVSVAIVEKAALVDASQ